MNPIFNPLDHPDAEVTRASFCQLTGRSKIATASASIRFGRGLSCGAHASSLKPWMQALPRGREDLRFGHARSVSASLPCAGNAGKGARHAPEVKTELSIKSQEKPVDAQRLWISCQSH